MSKFKISFMIITFFAILGIASSFAEEPTFNRYKPGEMPKEHFKSPKEKVLFIVDFSNSMNESIGNQRKIDIAVDTMYDILPQLNKDTWVGLRVYGHKNGFTPMQSCTASELISPVAQNNAGDIMNKLARVNATGWTPITYSLKQAVNVDFAGINGTKRIILLSDGGENCDESPCDYAIQLMQYRDDIKIDVIAFSISDNDANDQLKCAALMTSGRFYTANTAAQLANSLLDSLNMEKDVQGVIIKK